MLYFQRFSPLGENMIALEDCQLPHVCEWMQSMLNKRKAVYKKLGMFNSEEIDVVDA